MFHVPHDFLDESNAKPVSEAPVRESVVRDSYHDRHRHIGFNYFCKNGGDSQTRGDLRAVCSTHDRSFISARYGDPVERCW